MIPSLYIKLAAGVLIAGICSVGGYRIGASHWQTRYEALQAEDWKAKAVGEMVYRKAVEAQLAQAHATSANNAQVIRDLQDTTAAIAADRDRSRELARRLLASAARSRPASDPVSETPDQPRTARAGETTGTVEVGELLVDAAAECRGNAAQLDALIAQLRPQL